MRKHLRVCVIVCVFVSACVCVLYFLFVCSVLLFDSLQMCRTLLSRQTHTHTQSNKHRHVSACKSIFIIFMCLQIFVLFFRNAFKYFDFLHILSVAAKF